VEVRHGACRPFAGDSRRPRPPLRNQAVDGRRPLEDEVEPPGASHGPPGLPTPATRIGPADGAGKARAADQEGDWRRLAVEASIPVQSKAARNAASPAAGARSTTSGGFGSAIPWVRSVPTESRSGPALRRPPRLCSVEGCGRLHVGQGCAGSLTTGGDEHTQGKSDSVRYPLRVCVASRCAERSAHHHGRTSPRGDLSKGS
jgi:hypothetical protein